MASSHVRDTTSGSSSSLRPCDASKRSHLFASNTCNLLQTASFIYLFLKNMHGIAWQSF